MRYIIKILIILFFSIYCFSQSPLSGTVEKNKISKYNIIWSSPSKDYNGSMPIGNGDIALNTWIDEQGDLQFYIGKTDSWDDNGRLLKIGKVRIALEPKPSLKSFRQTLNLIDGTIKAKFGEGEKAIEIQIWVDANNPVIHVEIKSRQDIKAIASMEIWRNSKYTLPTVEVSDIMYKWPQDDKDYSQTVVEPDSVLKNQTDRIGWFHHNIKSFGPELSNKIQGLTEFKRIDPLLHRTFGAVITSSNPKRVDDYHIVSQSSKQHNFSIYVLTEHPSTSNHWLKSMNKLIQSTEKIPSNKLRSNHVSWWRNFWNRSWIDITNDKDNLENSDAFIVSRGYTLQRFINGCTSRGGFPIKFNGSILTVPFADRPGDADYRQWGPGYWWQNTRLPNFTMCAAGDFDLMQPLFKMYGKDLMPLFKYRTRHYFNHDGAFIPECIFFWGDVFTVSYGWTPFEKRTDKLQESGWHKWEWVSGLELAYLMLDYYEHTSDIKFFNEMALPTAKEILTFFDQHYETNENGKMVMRPSQALETWWECTNPMPELAGLHSITNRLLSFPTKLIKKEDRIFLTNLKKKLPDLPTRVLNNIKMLAPAEKFANKMNIENPELYSVFPFRLFSFEKPNPELAVEALKARTDRGSFGWRQDDIFMAYLGLADSARSYVTDRAKNSNVDSRFPAFWGPNYDWVPDQDHGSVLMKALQSMIMQTDGKNIFLIPAWPKDWNADFKLHAPYNTTIEGQIINGEIRNLLVLPKERMKDIFQK